MRIFMAGCFPASMEPLRKGIKNRLLSYHFIDGKSSGQRKEFLEIVEERMKDEGKKNRDR